MLSSSNKFNKKNKIVKHSDYLICYKNGKKYFTKNFIIFAKKNDSVSEESKNWRTGFAVPKKYGNAVKRNRLKRLLKEFVRLNQMIIPNNLDIVFCPKKNLQTGNYSLDFVTNELKEVVTKMQ